MRTLIRTLPLPLLGSKAERYHEMDGLLLHKISGLQLQILFKNTLSSKILNIAALKDGMSPQ